MESLKSFVTDANLLPMVTDWTIRIIFALAIYIIGKWIARRIMRFLSHFMEGRDVDATLVRFLSNVVYAILLTVVILAALDQLGLAVGLALKDSLGNFASGVMLVGFRPFSKGDFVEVAGIAGKVEEVRIHVSLGR